MVLVSLLLALDGVDELDEVIVDWIEPSIA
jgi:hypothetical protein